MFDDIKLLEALQDLSEFQPANDERGTALMSGRDLMDMDIGEILEQIAFFRMGKQVRRDTNVSISRDPFPTFVRVLFLWR